MSKANPIFTLERNGVVTKFFLQGDSVELIQMDRKSEDGKADVVILDAFTIRLLTILIGDRS